MYVSTRNVTEREREVEQREQKKGKKGKKVRKEAGGAGERKWEEVRK